MSAYSKREARGQYLEWLHCRLFWKAEYRTLRRVATVPGMLVRQDRHLWSVPTEMADAIQFTTSPIQNRRAIRMVGFRLERVAWFALEWVAALDWNTQLAPKWTFSNPPFVEDWLRCRPELHFSRFRSFKFERPLPSKPD
jgi:hypothetical protein